MSKFNICIAQPDNYVHSMAFIELGELIHYSLKELGHDSDLYFNKIEQDRINILFGCHLLNPSLITSFPKNTIVLNTEQIYQDSTNWNDNIFKWAEHFTVWDYSDKNIEKFHQLGITKTKHFKIGFQKELSRISPYPDQEVDVLFYGCINDRRKLILDNLVKSGLNIKILFGIYGDERDQWIRKSKVVLNHHFYNSQIFEIVRVFYLLTNSIAVVAEVNESTSIGEIYKPSICATPYSSLVDSCINLVRDQKARNITKKNAFDTILRYPQKTFTLEALG